MEYILVNGKYNKNEKMLTFWQVLHKFGFKKKLGDKDLGNSNTNETALSIYILLIC
jgi:hypothetical protein